ncbi:MAG: anti-sigma-factor antagonist [Bryobacterales bacterium]|nr:anti-sigma-factor antagonist [Bryobacterales bacterium]
MPEDAATQSAPKLTLITSTEGDATIIKCTGKLVAGVTGILQTEIKSLIPVSKRIVLDLTDLSYMDSSGLGTIIGLYASAKSAGTRLEIINLSKRVRELFSITNVLTLFEVCGEQNVRIP